MNEQFKQSIYNQEAREWLQKGKAFADTLRFFEIESASRADFILGPKLVEKQSSPNSRIFELENKGEFLGEVIITYIGSPNDGVIKAIQLLSKDRERTMLLQEFTGGVETKKGRPFSYDIVVDRIKFEKLTHLSDIVALSHEYGHAFEDREQRLRTLIASGKQQIMEIINNALPAKYIFLGEGSNYRKLLNKKNESLRRLFPETTIDIMNELQTTITVEDINEICTNEENASLYSIARLIEIFKFFNVSEESDLYKQTLEEQASYAAVCLKTYQAHGQDSIGFDPVQTIKDNHRSIIKFNIEPKDQEVLEKQV